MDTMNRTSGARGMRYTGLEILFLGILQIVVTGCGGGGQPPPQVAQAGQALGDVQEPQAPGPEGAVADDAAVATAEDTATTSATADGGDGALEADGTAPADGTQANATQDSQDVRQGPGDATASPSPDAGAGGGTGPTERAKVESGAKGLPQPAATKGAGTAPATGTGKVTSLEQKVASRGTGLVKSLKKVRDSQGQDFPYALTLPPKLPASTARWMGLTGAERLTEADDYLRRQGLTVRGRAMLLGAMWRETGFTLDPRQKQVGGPGMGLMQWGDPAKKLTSTQQLQRWAYERGTTWDDIDAQLSFAVNQNTALTGRLTNKDLDNPDKAAQVKARAAAIQTVYEMEHQAVRNDPTRDAFGDRIFDNLVHGRKAGEGF